MESVLRNCADCGSDGEYYCTSLRRELSRLGPLVKCWHPPGTIFIWDEEALDGRVSEDVSAYIRKVESKRGSR